MPQEADDPIGQARQGVNWLVGLSGAAIGGALAKLDWVLKFPSHGKVAFLFGGLFFLVSIIFGVFYSFELFSLKLGKQKLDEAQGHWPPDDAAVVSARTELVNSNEKVANFHNVTMAAFALAGIATVVCLGYVLFAPAPSPPPPPKLVPSNHYTLVNAPVYVRGKLSHSHTFLLNQQTGEAWLMTCRPDKTVVFRRVQRLDLNGTPEADVVPAMPAQTTSH
jgi:hypothetical protein